MGETFEALASLTPATARAYLTPWVTAHVDAPPEIRARFEANVRDSIASSSDDEVKATLAAFASAGAEHRYYPADPMARRVTRACMTALVDGARVSGIDRLRGALGRGPCLLLSNHLSYADTQITDVLLHLNGANDLADRLITVAGPKVYSDPFRRVAAVGLNTLHTAQSAGIGHNTAGLSPREVGRIALRTIAQGHELMASGAPLLVYGEGSRSRTGRMRSFLRGVSKYTELPGLWIVPVAMTGGDVIFRGDEGMLRPGPTRLAFDEPFAAGPLGRIRAVEEAWHRLVALLPDDYKPEAGTPPIA